MQNQLTLIQIASWQLGRLVPDDQPSWVATLPSLQRDAVWKPGQVELLWDSLFRGFPIGSLVISDELKDQKSRYGKLAGGNDPWPGIQKRHLLDGQQRCNSIALGFYDPFAVDALLFGGILWLDLCPDSQAFKSSTRHFVFRLTTTSHPWGYDYSDAAAKLHASEIQEVLRGCNWKPNQNDIYQRPAPIDLRPAKANKPIPVSWLLHDSDKHGVEFMAAIQKRCESFAKRHTWATVAATWLREAAPDALLEIENGLRRAIKATVLALEVPSQTIRAKSKQEDGGADTEGANLSNVEHLFQRINNGGTPLSPEDLQYSMIKAYWPGVEGTIDLLQPRPMRASRLALLGCRAAFASARSEKLPSGVSVSTLRALAGDDPQQAEKKSQMEMFFGLADCSLQIITPPICQVIKLIDSWLLHRGQRDIGLPPVVRTSVAHHSPDVYLLLMILAQRVLTEQANAESFRLPVLALTTTLHWFGYDQHRVVQRIYGMLQSIEELTPNLFEGILSVNSQVNEPSGVWDLISPAELGKIIICPDEEHLGEWNWEQAIIDQPSLGRPEEKLRLQNQVWPIVCRIRSNKELLIFAQREWLGIRFKSFDNANTLAWEDHNRPWDFDHLLPQNIFHDVRNADYLRVCQQWGNTIGNFHILPFEENRSRSDRSANATFTDQAHWHRMLVQAGEMDAFSLTRHGVVNDRKAVFLFVRAARRRTLAIFDDWYTTLEIAYLFRPKR